VRHGLAIVVASALLVMGSQTRVAADSGSLLQGSQDSQTQPRVQADMGTLGAVTMNSGSQLDLRLLAAGMAPDPSVVAKSSDDNEKDKKDKHHHHDGDHQKDHKDKDKDHDPGDLNPDNWGRGCDTGTDTGMANTPSSPTPEPGTLLLTGLIAASAGLRARRARKSG